MLKKMYLNEKKKIRYLQYGHAIAVLFTLIICTTKELQKYNASAIQHFEKVEMDENSFC